MKGVRVRIGGRLRSAVSPVEVMVVRAPEGDLDVRCGGAPMFGPEHEPATAVSAGGSDGIAVVPGRRYRSDALGVEVLCTRAGVGPLTVGDVPLEEVAGGSAGDREPRRPRPGADGSGGIALDLP